MKSNHIYLSIIIINIIMRSCLRMTHLCARARVCAVPRRTRRRRRGDGDGDDGLGLQEAPDSGLPGRKRSQTSDVVIFSQRRPPEV